MGSLLVVLTYVVNVDVDVVFVTGLCVDSA